MSQHIPESIEYPLFSEPATYVRTIKDPKARDGWLCKDIQTRRVCFIKDIAPFLLTLSPGQVWSYTVLASFPKYDIIELDTKIV